MLLLTVEVGELYFHKFEMRYLNILENIHFLKFPRKLILTKPSNLYDITNYYSQISYQAKHSSGEKRSTAVTNTQDVTPTAEETSL